MRLPLIASLVLPAIALGDAGILGSVVRGPAALSDSGPAVRMLAQDVLISLDRRTYEITGCFLLHSAGDEGTVYMYFPVDIITPFVSMLYSSTKPDPLLDRVDVTVDGARAEVFPMFVCEWNPSEEPSLPCWESVREMTGPLFPEEPDPGEPFYATRIPAVGQMTDSCTDWEADLPGIHSQALNAAWSADFGVDDTILVEYHVTGSMTLDYDSTFSIFCYPPDRQHMGGTIGRGRVTVVTGEPDDPGIIEFIAGSMLPPAESLPASFEPLPEIAGHPAFDATRLSRLAETVFSGGFRWTFSDFEPSAGTDDWLGLFPGLGEMATAYYIGDDVREWRLSRTGPRPASFGGAFIYAFLSDSPPTRLTVTDLEGVPLRIEPDGSGGVTEILEVGTRVDLRERRGFWALVDCSSFDYVNLEDIDHLSGWIEMFRTGKDGLVRPAALPML